MYHVVTRNDIETHSKKKRLGQNNIASHRIIPFVTVFLPAKNEPANIVVLLALDEEIVKHYVYSYVCT